MFHRLACFTVVSTILCIIGLPMAISYEMACKRLGPGCLPNASTQAWQPMEAATARSVTEGF
jgi:hypothetical protein